MHTRALGLSWMVAASVFGQAGAPPLPPPRPPTPEMKEGMLEASMADGVRLLLAAQEGPEQGEWPYEGVYRVGREIPVGYRVGGTAICASALLAAPGYAEDAARQAAVARAVDAVCAGIEQPLMSVDGYDGGYDVRGWGYAYGARFLLELEAAGAIPAGREASVEKALAFYLDGIERTQIPEAGGWNYARPAGKGTPSAPSSFMTAATLQTLFLAQARGRPVAPATVERALAFLEKSRTPAGSVVYSGEGSARSGRRDGVPGAVGRMCIVEATLAMAGRGSPAAVRGAVDAFITHWDWLNARRAQGGTHVAPYGVAPYYFMFAHYHAAQAIELLPRHERAEYRRRVSGLLFSVRQADGGWNDRVFPRSAAYGTAMALLAITQPDRPLPEWKAAQAE